MEKICKSFTFSKTRLYMMYNLVFFALFFSSCTDTSQQEDVSIVKKGDRSVALFIPSNLIEKRRDSHLDKDVLIRMKGQSDNVLGEYTIDNYGVLFTPLVEMSPGNKYEILYKMNRISELTIPRKTARNNPSLKAIYPSSDTLPENLLKLYLSFSSPMRQGVSDKYIAILDGKGDTLHNIFLNLNTELWDEEGKQLTIWLDPGRIKRGLHPNEESGNPLITGGVYTLIISAEWPNLDGDKLDKTYSKKFTSKIKDIRSPDPSLWKLNIPASGSRQALSIQLNEPLDYALLSNTIMMTDHNGQRIKGQLFIKNQERLLLFYPGHHWMKGTYYLKIDSRLEDLAGNNLNRLFDRDLLKDKKAGTDEFFTRQFSIN